LKVNNTIQNNRWKGIPCKCNHDSVETEYPITDCLHCKFQECEDSIPKENFKINEAVMDKDEKPTGETKVRTVKEINLIHGDRYQDVIGWTF
jgi:hypothetical protein